MSDRLVTVTLRANVASDIRDISGAAAATGGFAKQVDSADRGIDKFSGRLGLLLDSVASLGPSLVPISAVGIPAVTGLAASLGFVATGLGAVLASAYGVSDSLKALNKYALEPTDENLQKVEQTLLKLAPEAQMFVLQLRRLGPELKEIRDAGAGELFPHWSDAIEDLETLLPTVEELVTRVARKVGEISEQGAESLASPRWTEFFSFLQDETPLALGKLAKSVGSLGHATAELWMAFDPLNDDFLNVLVRGSDQIDEWATGLSKTEGFKEFVDYIEANGPQVGETVGAIAMALLDIVEAAAPIGAATLPILEAVADVLGVIADSDLGTPILGVLALSRGLAMLERARPTGLISDFKAIRANDPWSAAMSGGLREATKQTERYDAAVGRVRGTLMKVGGTGGAVAGLMAVQSGLTDEIGLTNTALGASLGLMAGPYGAAIGGLIGFGMDLTKSQESAAASVEDLTATLDAQTGALTANTRATVAKALEDAGVLEAAEKVGLGLDIVTEAALGNKDAMHQVALGYVENFSAASSGDAAAQKLNGSWEMLNNTLHGQNANVNEAVESGERLAAATVEHANAAEHAVSPTEAVAAAIDDMGDKSLTASEKADALAASLDALLGPGLDLSAATDAWRAGLRDLNSELSDNGRRLVGFTKDATDNREAIRGRVTDLVAMLKADAAAGAGSAELTKKLRNGREALLNVGEAAGLSRPKLREYLNTLGLTPKLVQTILKVTGDLEAKGKAKDAKREYDLLKAPVITQIKADNSQALAGARAAQAALDRLHDVTVTIRTQHMDIRLGEPRATGGPVKAGSTYIVGERRPEVFVPDTDGTILPSVPSRTVPGGSGGGPGTGNSGGGSDAVGLLGQILQALTGSDMGPGAIRGFMKELDELQREVGKHNHAIAAYNKKVAAWNKAHPDADPHKFRKGGWTDELREQAHDILKEIREAEKERARAIREAFKSFEDDLTQGAAAIRTELRDLKRDLREAGGVWNGALHKHAQRILALATKYDRQAAALEAEQKTLDDLTATGADLASKWQSLSDTVAGNFSSDLFGKGLGGFFGAAGKDTAQATMFHDVLGQLAGMGLDGPAFQALAESGDLKTATQLLSSGMIDAFEQALGARTTALGSLGGFAGDTVFGQAIADNNAQIAQQNVLIASTQATMQHLQVLVDRQQGVLRDLAGLERRVGQSAYEGTRQGAEDGIKGVTGNAGRRLAMAGGGRP